MGPTLIVLGVLAVIVLFYIIRLYNGLVRKKVAADGAWSDIDV